MHGGGGERRGRVIGEAEAQAGCEAAGMRDLERYRCGPDGFWEAERREVGRPAGSGRRRRRGWIEVAVAESGGRATTVA
jgi:hypothetical protein